MPAFDLDFTGQQRHLVVSFYWYDQQSVVRVVDPHILLELGPHECFCGFHRVIQHPFLQAHFGPLYESEIRIYGRALLSDGLTNIDIHLRPRLEDRQRSTCEESHHSALPHRILE